MSSNKDKCSKDDSDLDSNEKEMDEFEEFLSRRLSRGQGRFKGELPLICFQCNEVGHIAARCPNKSMNDKKDKEQTKYQRNKD